ncbi:MAG: hypothetical protein ACXABY_14185 [Candidatus Thorarchaeota archaeon]|jgi:hypothetical protein
MWFELQAGRHQGKDKKLYEVEVTRDEKTGQVVSIKKPLIDTDVDLVSAFGDRKFRRVPDAEAKALVEAAIATEGAETEGSEEAPSAPATSPPVEEEVVEEKEEVEGFEGKDVTEKFPKAKKYNLLVYYKPVNKYSVVDPDNLSKPITDAPVSKAKVDEVIEAYLET